MTKKLYWEVIDRTTGKVVSVENWVLDKERNIVTVHGAEAFHEYTVSF